MHPLHGGASSCSERRVRARYALRGWGFSSRRGLPPSFCPWGSQRSRSVTLSNMTAENCVHTERRAACCSCGLCVAGRGSSAKQSHVSVVFAGTLRVWNVCSVEVCFQQTGRGPRDFLEPAFQNPADSRRLGCVGLRCSRALRGLVPVRAAERTSCAALETRGRCRRSRCRRRSGPCARRGHGRGFAGGVT